MKYFIVTFGCQMNESDSERIAKILKQQGYKPAQKEIEADLVLVNMCSVRQSAVDRVFGQAEKLKKMKKTLPAGRQVKTVLTGCILQKDRKKFAGKFDKIMKFKDLMTYEPRHQNKQVANIPISNGCNNACTYCAVPFARGRLICRDHKEIIREIKSIVRNPIRKNNFSNGAEVWLLGQNVNDYQSPSDKSINFAKLLKMATDVPGKFHIRFMSPNPKNFSDELIDVMASSKKIAKFLNLPLQSGDDKILKKMNRPYTVKQYKNLVKKIREKIPGINLTTDIIIGFPGETKKQFENTAKLFKELKFNLAYISKYSPRLGTAAAKMKGEIPLSEKKQREIILRQVILKNAPKN